MAFTRRMPSRVAGRMSSTYSRSCRGMSGTPPRSSFSARTLLPMNDMGLLISWATPAASTPRPVSFSCASARSWTAFSFWWAASSSCLRASASASIREMIEVRAAATPYTGAGRMVKAATTVQEAPSASATAYSTTSGAATMARLRRSSKPT